MTMIQEVLKTVEVPIIEALAKVDDAPVVRQDETVQEFAGHQKECDIFDISDPSADSASQTVSACMESRSSQTADMPGPRRSSTNGRATQTEDSARTLDSDSQTDGVAFVDQTAQTDPTVALASCSSTKVSLGTNCHPKIGDVVKATRRFARLRRTIPCGSLRAAMG